MKAECAIIFKNSFWWSGLKGNLDYRKARGSLDNFSGTKFKLKNC